LNKDKHISSLQYITQDVDEFTHQHLAERACNAGIDWIQLRIKDKSENEIITIAQETKNICDKYNATLIINDHVTIAKAINAHGVHLGKTDMDAAQAREILGENFIIGGTANTFNDIVELASKGVDYIGLGPFRFTTTKKNLSPVLGLNGYKSIIDECKLNNIHVPIIAIGGITNDDTKQLYTCGISGIAVSSAITFSKDIKTTINGFLND
jgi:thiamine-phosphate pyrophosphorylase